jgi:lipocalin
MLAAALAASLAALLPQAARLDPKACMGTWYVQYQKPALAFLEKGATNGVEEYCLDQGGDGFSVTYSFNREGAADDEVTTVRQRGWFKSETGTEWQVAPVVGGVCPPFVRLPFIIIDCDPDSHMVCSGGLTSWLYCMSRARKPDKRLAEMLLSKVEEAGFDMSAVEPMIHDQT